MIMVYARETETVPRVRKISDKRREDLASLRSMVSRLYRSGYAYVELVDRDEDGETAETKRESR